MATTDSVRITLSSSSSSFILFHRHLLLLFSNFLVGLMPVCPKGCDVPIASTHLNRLQPQRRRHQKRNIHRKTQLIHAMYTALFSLWPKNNVPLSFSSDVIPSGCLGSKHQLTNCSVFQTLMSHQKRIISQKG